jgi:hypothetical protein
LLIRSRSSAVGWGSGFGRTACGGTLVGLRTACEAPTAKPSAVNIKVRTIIAIAAGLHIMIVLLKS